MGTMLGHQFFYISGNMFETYITYSKYVHVECWSDYGGCVFGYASVLITGLTPFQQ